jgi:ATP-dependent Lon protease
MNVYEIAAPDRDGSARIAQSIYSDIRGSHDWGKAFPERLGDAVVDKVAECSPREMRRVLMNAFGNAKLAGRDEIAPADVGDSRAARKQRIGF